MQNGTLLAAIDLGSNSFRLEIGRLEHNQIQRTEYLKETVRQGNGLDADRNLTQEAMQRGWDCLARFAERLAGFKKSQVRAVATQTLREARNRDIFLLQAHKILGFPIDVISGREEARLIYQGVAHFLPLSIDQRRLVVDIGGRSTEMIIGCGLQAHTMESYRLGSVAWSMRYFPDGDFTRRAFASAEIAALAVLDDATVLYRPDTWDTAYGSSGTIGAVCDVLAMAGGNRWTKGIVTKEGLDWLLNHLMEAQNARNLRLEGMKDDRRAVIGGGLSVLRAVFKLLNIEQMEAAQGALRHGVLFDMLDREQAETDVRVVTVQRLAQKFTTDLIQGRRVSQVAQHLFNMVNPELVASDKERFLRKLDWAGTLHEIGTCISHSEHHKHGAYILDNADAPGFAQPELHRLSQLVLGHKGKLRKLEANFEDTLLMQQLLCLRLAVILCHARIEPNLKGLLLNCNILPANQWTNQAIGTFVLQCRQSWGTNFPQSMHLLQEESIAWQKTPWIFEIVEI